MANPWTVGRRLLRSLKVRILLGGTAAMLLSVGAFTGVLLQSAQRNTLAAEHRREINEAASAALRLSNQIVALQRSLGVAAGQLHRSMLDDSEALVRFAESQTYLRQAFSHVFVASVDGSVRISIESRGVSARAIDLSQQRYFNETVAQERSIISRALQGGLSSAPVIAFTQPVRDKQGLFAVLGGSVRLDNRDLLEGLVDSQSEDTTTMVVVTDEFGQILAHPDPALLLRPLSDERRLTSAFAAWQVLGAPVEPAGLELPQPDEVVSAAGAAGPNWMIWRVRSRADLLAPLHDARLKALSTAAALLLGVVPLLLAAMWWLLRPLGQLEHRARHMFDGTYPPEHGWPRASGEIANLSKVLRSVGIDRTRLETENAEMLGKLSSVMSAAPMGIAFAHGNRFELLNMEFCQLFGGAERDLLDEELQARFWSKSDFDSFVTQQGIAFSSGEACSGEWQMRRCDGTSFWAALRCGRVQHAGATPGTVWTINDAGETRSSRQRLEWAATHDPLTGLANRKAFESRASRLIEMFPQARPASMVFIDLDRFKPVNDTAGHQMGDLMLIEVAKAIAGQVRSGDLVSRIGGDEFALLLEACCQEQAMSIADSVRRAILAVRLPWKHGALHLGASLGVAELNTTHTEVARWIDAADAACYAAKASGRDAVRSA